MAASSSPPPPPSAVSSLISSELPAPSADAAVSLEILHNLQHQHLWADLQIHESQSLSPQLTKPLISGIPPQPIYTHPDEQMYMLENEIPPESIPREREWIIPTSQGETWSLRRLAGLFDALPPKSDDLIDGSTKYNTKIEEFISLKKKETWGKKRAILAMVNRGMGGDGTVVYYVVSDGTVKPRQN